MHPQWLGVPRAGGDTLSYLSLVHPRFQKHVSGRRSVTNACEANGHRENPRMWWSKLRLRASAVSNGDLWVSCPFCSWCKKRVRLNAAQAGTPDDTLTANLGKIWRAGGSVYQHSGGTTCAMVLVQWAPLHETRLMTTFDGLKDDRRHEEHRRKQRRRH